MVSGNRTHCRTCCKPVSSPYRVYDSNGKVVAGCIDADHDGHLVSISESAFWHNRKEAQKMRQESAKKYPRVK